MKKSLFVLALLLSAACSTQIPVNNNNNAISTNVIEVIDGDTVKLSDGQLLRYIGIDTPETRVKKHGQFIWQPQPFAVEAKKYNQKLVENKSVRIELDITKNDKYSRLLGYCFVGEIFINAKLLEEGLAVLYTIPPNVKYSQQLIAAQKKARDNKRGIWASYATIDAKDAAQFVNKACTVRGKVLSVRTSSKCTYLNFGADYKTDFTVVVFKQSYPSFAKKGIKHLSFYKDKTIKVTGRIKKYNGPEIIINGPEEIIMDEN